MLGDGPAVAVSDHFPFIPAAFQIFNMVGGGYARKLEAHGIYTMGDVARCSLTDEDLLYKLFGVNAELLIQ